jgi:hypothetical protein
VNRLVNCSLIDTGRKVTRRKNSLSNLLCTKMPKINSSGWISKWSRREQNRLLLMAQVLLNNLTCGGSILITSWPSFFFVSFHIKQNLRYIYWIIKEYSRNCDVRILKVVDSNDNYGYFHIYSTIFFLFMILNLLWHFCFLMMSRQSAHHRIDWYWKANSCPYRIMPD